jgi:hypothetical protein
MSSDYLQDTRPTLQVGSWNGTYENISAALQKKNLEKSQNFLIALFCKVWNTMTCHVTDLLATKNKLLKTLKGRDKHNFGTKDSQTTALYAYS